ncbi:uncharacterized protein B0H18DRAFT_464356 [Fomitopsis serialis]|uniref:uncharacterized protein n=1 Tax=Fomitopsis serialis TaxID=139415 RepID=UPI0020078F51|nr:uncharacterized protein B0H18DRAFT_464356 [Neoantrodia serialis]KAH9923522.1 hypothetical protein B0H18DRAFT_464356 [Neoantrodia serialis]
MSTPVADDARANLGTFLIGNLADAVLFGVTTVQTYNYLMSRSSDSIMLGILLSLCWIIDTLQLSFFSHLTYSYAVTDVGDFAALGKILWCFPAIIFLTGLSDFIVRSLFCYRIWKLSERNAALAVALCFNSITVFALNCGLVAKTTSIQTIDAFRSKTLSGLIYAGLVDCLCGNILIAMSLYIILKKHLRAASNSRTTFVVRTLIAYSVETGATTSICALICLVTYAAMTHNSIYIALYSVLSKVSLNALLATLNARRGLRANDELRGEGIISVAGSVAKLLSGKVNTDRRCGRDIQVTVQTTVDQLVDGEPLPKTSMLQYPGGDSSLTETVE